MRADQGRKKCGKGQRKGGKLRDKVISSTRARNYLANVIRQRVREREREECRTKYWKRT